MDNCKAIEEFNFNSVIPRNSSLSDFRQTYLKKQSRILIDSSTDIHSELIRKYKLCNNLLNVYLKREILTKLERVRYKLNNDLWEVRIKSEETKLTSKMKRFLQIMSGRGYEFLQNEGIFQDFVETDNSTETFVLHKGKIVNLKLNLDIICPQNNKINVESSDPNQSKNHESCIAVSACENGMKFDPNDIRFKLMKPPKGILKQTRPIHPDLSDANMNQTIVELDDSDSDDEVEQLNKPDPVKNIDTLVLNFVLSLRKSIPANIVFKQYLSRLISRDQKNLLLVFHVGPLIKDQEIVLYEYICNKDIILAETEAHIDSHDSSHMKHSTLNKMTNITPQYGRHGQPEPTDGHSKYPNLDMYIECWMKNENKLAHQFSNSTDSVRDSIYEYQGLEKLQVPKVKKEKPKKTTKKDEK